MIEFSCQACGKSLRVSSDKAGKSALCPSCKERIRIPMPQPAAPPQPAPRSAPATRAPDLPGFEVVDDEPAAPAKQKLTTEKPAARPRPMPQRTPEPSPLDDDAEPPESSREDEEDRPRKKRKRRKRRKTKSLPQVSDTLVFAVGLLLLVGVWGLAMGIKVAGVYIAGLTALAIAGITAACGRMWFLMIAYSEDSTTGTLCLMFWPYSLYFMISNLAETWKPFAIEVLGGILVVLALSAGVLYDQNDLAPIPPNIPNSPGPDADDDQDDAPAPAVPPGIPPRRNRRRWWSLSDRRQGHLAKLLGQVFRRVIDGPTRLFPIGRGGPGSARGGADFDVCLRLRFGAARP